MAHALQHLRVELGDGQPCPRLQTPWLSRSQSTQQNPRVSSAMVPTPTVTFSKDRGTGTMGSTSRFPFSNRAPPSHFSLVLTTYVSVPACYPEFSTM